MENIGSLYVACNRVIRRSARCAAMSLIVIFVFGWVFFFGPDITGTGAGKVLAADTGTQGNTDSETADNTDEQDDSGTDDAADQPSEEDSADDPAEEEPEESEEPEEPEEPEESEEPEEPEDEETDGDEGDDQKDLEDDADDDDDSEPEEGDAASTGSGERRLAIDGLCKGNFAALRKLGCIKELNPLGMAEPSAATDEEHGNEPLALSEALKLNSAGKPRYEIGDTYVYSDGSWEQVVAANPDRVEWRNHFGNASIGNPDFTYKRSKWQTKNRSGTRLFKQTSYLFEKSTSTIWPLTPKSKTRYDEWGRWIGKDGIERIYDSFWRCDVEGEERVTVAAGEFDTWRIRCARYPDSFSYPKSRAREYRTWYYAPAVRHWVLLERDNRGYRPDSRKELVAILPDLQELADNPQAVVQVQQQFQEVLEVNESNQADMWMVAAGNVAVTLRPQATYQNDEGIFCRQYTQQIETPEVQKTYAGIGCRSPEGTWYIPRR